MYGYSENEVKVLNGIAKIEYVDKHGEETIKKVVVIFLLKEGLKLLFKYLF